MRRSRFRRFVPHLGHDSTPHRLSCCRRNGALGHIRVPVRGGHDEPDHTRTGDEIGSVRTDDGCAARDRLLGDKRTATCSANEASMGRNTMTAKHSINWERFASISVTIGTIVAIVAVCTTAWFSHRNIEATREATQLSLLNGVIGSLNEAVTSWDSRVFRARNACDVKQDGLVASLNHLDHLAWLRLGGHLSELQDVMRGWESIAGNFTQDYACINSRHKCEVDYANVVQYLREKDKNPCICTLECSLTLEDS